MNFYLLQVGREHKFVECADTNDWESISCAKDPGHQRAGQRLTALCLDVLSPIAVDFSRTMLSDIVITDRALDVLRGARLTGFEVKAARVEGPARARGTSALPALWELVVRGRGGPARKDSGIVEVFYCDSCGLVEHSAFEHGIQVDEATYDGSDFFSVSEYPKYVLVSSRARDVIVRAGLTNVAFVDSSELEWPRGVNRPGESG